MVETKKEFDSRELTDFDAERRRLQMDIELAELREKKSLAEKKALIAQIEVLTLQAKVRELQKAAKEAGAESAEVKEEEKLEEWDNYQKWFQFDPNNVKKQSDKFLELQDQRVNEGRDFWITKKPGQRWGLVEHLRRFRRDAGYRTYRLETHKKYWGKYADEHGRMQKEHMSDFCENVWGFNMGEHG